LVINSCNTLYIVVLLRSATIVVVSFEQLKGKINIQYKDNGVGCTLFKGNGLQNTESRIAAINGSIIFESQINNGFKAIMSI
jgi:signal transduction histidine kinase